MILTPTAAEAKVSPQDPQELRAGWQELLVVCLATGLGGSTRSLATILERIPSSLRRVVCTPGNGPFLRHLRHRGLLDGHLEIPNRGARLKGKLSRVVAMLTIARWVHGHRRVVSVIHANGPEELNLVAPVARLYKVPVVVWSHARDVSPWMRRLRPLLRPLLRKVDVRWAAVSDHARGVLVEAGLCSRQEVAIIPNPIDAADVAGGERAPSDKLVIGYLGSDAPYKGFLLLPEIIRATGDEPVQWLVFSNERSSPSGDAWRRLRELSPDLVTVVGKMTDVRAAYARCDVVFMPSLDESFGRVAAEAMLNGLPVVASDLPPVREVLGGSDSGLLFPPGDVDSAVRCIKEVIADSDLRAALGKSGRRRAELYEPRSVVAALTRLYEDDREIAG